MVGQWKFLPCSSCCGCDYLLTFFPDFPSDNLQDWTEVSGDWIIEDNPSAGAWLSTADSNAIAITTTSPGQNDLVVNVDVDIDPTKVVRVIVNFVDSDNYNYVELSVSGFFGVTYTLRLVERLATVETELDSVTGQTFPGHITGLTVCTSARKGIIALAKQSFGSLTLLYVYGNGTLSSDATGVGSGTITTAARFNSFRLSKHVDEAAECLECLPCGCGEDPPNEVELVIDGLFSGSCYDCPTIDGTYILDLQRGVSAELHQPGIRPFASLIPPQACVWEFDFGGTPCSADVLRMYMNPAAALYAYLKLGTQQYLWSVIPPSGIIDCQAFSETLVLTSVPSAARICEAAGSIVTATAIANAS